MISVSDPARYEAWYHTPRGRWVSDREFHLLKRLLNPGSGESLLDVGCGTGHFSRLFAGAGCSVTGIDPDQKALHYAKSLGGAVEYLSGSTLRLPFEDGRFDAVTAITSLCFVEPPEQALQEMWRVTRRTLVLGLLNRHSLLYRQRHLHASYRSARWDSLRRVRKRWVPTLSPVPAEMRLRSALFLPRGSAMDRCIEAWLPDRLPWGGFLALALSKA